LSLINLMSKCCLKTVLDKLDNRISQGFGDFTAIETETPENEDGTLNEKLGAIHLYAQSGRASLWCRYLVGDQFLPNGKQRHSPVMSVPEGWPDPNMEDVLRKVKIIQASEYFVSDGEHQWPTTMPKISLPEEIWFGRKKLLLNTRRPFFHPHRTKAKLLEDINRPGLISLYVEGYIDRCDFRQRQRIEQTRWIDPNCDDMPVETQSIDYKPDRKTVEFRFLTRYLNYAQLSDGRWYPKHWRMTTEIGVQQRKSCQQSHLQIFAGMKLYESCFTNPEQQVTNNLGKE